MTDKLAQLERLNKLLDEGRISESEYTDLKADVLNESGGEQVATHSPDDSAEPRPAPTPAPTRADTPAIYKVALGAGIVSIFFGGTFGLLAWATVAIGAWALYSVKVDSRRWMAWTGLALGVVFSLMNLYLNGHLDAISGTSGWTEAEMATVRGSCVEKDASPICGDLSVALQNGGCTVDEALSFIEDEAHREPEGGFLTGRRGIQGAVVHCEFQAEFRP